MKKAMIILSVVLNVLLIAALVYIGGYKTDYFKRAQAKLTHTPYVPQRVDYDCVESWNNCIEKLDMEVDVVFFGDSETAGGDFQKAFPEVKSINLGYIGEDVKGMLRRVDAIKAVKPKKVFLMAGINGLRNQTMDEFEYWYAALVDAIQRDVPDAELYIESILPVTCYSDYCENAKIREANAIIQRMAAERNLHYINVHDAYAHEGALPDAMSYDGLHLTEDAYSIWYEVIRKSIDDR
jgi:lysophospholipase L1-like esterase